MNSETDRMLFKRIQDDLKTALKNKDKLTVSTLRFLISAIHNKEIELLKRGRLSDDEVILVIRQQVKQHQESIEAFQKGKRDDLAQKEAKELKILSKYLPQDFSPKELKKIVKKVIDQMGVIGEKDFGKVMGVVMGKVKGRAEGKTVAEVVKQQLGKT